MLVQQQNNSPVALTETHKLPNTTKKKYHAHVLQKYNRTKTWMLSQCEHEFTSTKNTTNCHYIVPLYATYKYATINNNYTQTR